jgi:hypothetical protein
MTRSLLTLILALFVVVPLASCNGPGPEQRPETAGAATAEGSSFGVVVRNPSVEELASVQSLQAKIEQIDAAHPRSALPDPGAPLYKVSAVEADGRIAIEGGRAVRLGGIDCSTEGIGQISRLLMFEGSRITYRPTSPDTPGAAPVEIWLTDVSGGGPPSYSLVAETALISGWCIPAETLNRSRNARYQALAALATRGKAGNSTRAEQ